MTPSWVLQPALRRFIDQLSDAVLLLDGDARLAHANPVAQRALACRAGEPLAALRSVVGHDAVRWAEACVASLAGGRALPEAPAPLGLLPDGRRVRLAWQPLDGPHSALRLQLGPPPAMSAPLAMSAPPGVPSPPPAPAPVERAPRDLLRLLWRLPFPAALHDDTDRIVDVNQAYVDFTGHPRQALIGLDPQALQPAEDRAAAQAADPPPPRSSVGGLGAAPVVRRLIDGDGRERWYRAARSAWRGGDGTTLQLVLLQDCTAERDAAEHQERMRAVLDSVLVGIVTVGADGIEWMNRSARRMFGGGLEAFQGQPMSVVATDDPHHPLRRPFDPEGGGGTFECTLAARDGRVFRVVGNVVATASGAGRQLTYALLDVERRRPAEARAGGDATVAP